MPVPYSQEVAEVICERLANGESLRNICSEPSMPNKATVFRWVAQNPEFAQQYALARDAQADGIFDEVLDIMDQKPKNMVEAVHKRDRVEARKWVAGKLRPKKYGDKIDLEHTGQVAIKRIVSDL